MCSGEKWLIGLGEMKANFELKVNGETTVLKAEHDLIKTYTSMKLVKRA